MNDFSITRIPDHNLFGLLFPPLTDISEYMFEIIQPEYIKNYYISSAGTPTSGNGRQYAILDLNNFDFALVPVHSTGSGNTTGFRANPSSGAIVNDQQIYVKTPTTDTAAYMLAVIQSTTRYACINSILGADLPVIGLKRTRSDGVNPKSPAKEPDVKEEPIEEPVEKTVKRSTKK